MLPTGVYLASTSRCCWCALTAPLHPYPLTLCDFRCSLFDAISNLTSQISNRGAVSFCGTILTIARTGRYPASLVFREPGLSSDQLSLIRNRLRLLYSPDLLYAIVRQSLWDFRFPILTCRALNFDICVYSNSCAVAGKPAQHLNCHANPLQFTHG